MDGFVNAMVVTSAGGLVLEMDARTGGDRTEDDLGMQEYELTYTGIDGYSVQMRLGRWELLALMDRKWVLEVIDMDGFLEATITTRTGVLIIEMVDAVPEKGREFDD